MTYYLTFKQFTDAKAPRVYTKKTQPDELLALLQRIIDTPELFELISVTPAS